MISDANRLVDVCRRAGQKNDWETVRRCARELIGRNPASADGFFFLGLAEKAAQKMRASADAFETCPELDANRFDAGIELASHYATLARNDAALALLQRFAERIANGPWYLDPAESLFPVTPGKSRFSWFAFREPGQPWRSALCPVIPG